MWYYSDSDAKRFISGTANSFWSVCHVLKQRNFSAFPQFCNTFPWLMDHLPGRHNKILADIEELLASAKEKIHKHQETLTPDCPRDFIDCFLARLNQVLSSCLPCTYQRVHDIHNTDHKIQPLVTSFYCPFSHMLTGEGQPIL